MYPTFHKMPFLDCFPISNLHSCYPLPGNNPSPISASWTSTHLSRQTLVLSSPGSIPFLQPEVVFPALLFPWHNIVWWLNTGFWSWVVWMWIQALSFNSCVNLGELLILSEPYFVHLLKKGGGAPTFWNGYEYLMSYIHKTCATVLVSGSMIVMLLSVWHQCHGTGCVLSPLVSVVQALDFYFTFCILMPTTW